MVTFPVDSDFPLLIIFSQRHSWKKQFYFPNTKQKDINYTNELYCSLPVESVCFLIFIENQSVLISLLAIWVVEILLR